MRHCLISCLSSLLVIATAHADTIMPGIVTKGSLSVHGVRTSMGTSTTYDLITVYLDSLSGTLTGQSVTTVQGIWTAGGPGGAIYLSSLSDWASITGQSSYRTAQYDGDNNLIGYTYNNFTVVNFPTVNAAAYWGRTQSGTSTVQYSSFRGGWYGTGNWLAPNLTSDTDGDGMAENVVAVLRVTKPTTSLSLSCVYESQFDVNAWCFAPSGGHSDVAFTLVPEPGTLVLLASGVVGVLFCARGWKRERMSKVGQKRCRER
jgi:hypothetical protein